MVGCRFNSFVGVIAVNVAVCIVSVADAITISSLMVTVVGSGRTVAASDAIDANARLAAGNPSTCHR
jgi:hypothetical protein